VQQIAIGGLDKSKLRNFWVDTLGVAAKGNFRDEGQNVDEDILELGHGPHAVEIDLMQPIDPERSPKVHSPALNHVGLWVDDLPGAVEWLTANGVRFTPGGIRPGAAGHDVCFIHPKGGHDVCFIHPKGNEQSPIGAEGVLVELVQAPPEVIEALGTA
jgi:lactoylglutathione lyase